MKPRTIRRKFEVFCAHCGKKIDSPPGDLRARLKATVNKKLYCSNNCHAESRTKKDK